MENYLKDIPIIQEVVNGTWAKESRLSELKIELASIERKIMLSIASEAKEGQEEKEEEIKDSKRIESAPKLRAM